ncbi:hypothetical protein LOCC1_G002385 [Lachnellula occidentalis]|uniref:Uncharacterized protein n=1 Tax=Lachnellula occidentalis TaxID=215460 RepID=A0A8H8UJW6_9HELO|nr:hypothetical protein LOCC1_G002385 [Lachnellula occidentalis]
MRYFDQSFSSSSPILVQPPQLPPQPSFKMNPNRQTFTSPFEKGNNHQGSSPSWSDLPASAPPSAAGRKRSRDEAAPNLGDDDLLDPAPQSKPQENEAEWEYGEGMVLIKPNVGYVMEADSQTGTWAEEKLEEKPKPALSPERPILRASKSQRLNSTVPSFAEEVLQNGELVASSPERCKGLTEPTIDDFTRHLGIGWSLISANEHIQAAARGWTKYIENHYPVTNAKIRLQSKGLASYLVEANEGYFLFGEDLKQGRLVWENLRGPQPIFDGEVTMDAGETPKANGGLHPMTTIDETHMESLNVIAMNGQSSSNEVEMDLS